MTPALDRNEETRPLARISMAYMLLLKLPHGTSRHYLQPALVSLRDEVARLTNRPAEDVQNEYEAVAARYVSAGGQER